MQVVNNSNSRLHSAPLRTVAEPSNPGLSYMQLFIYSD